MVASVSPFDTLLFNGDGIDVLDLLITEWQLDKE